MNEMDSVIQEFLIESHDNLDQLDRDFIALEGDADCREKLARIFRTIHTIKGTCGFLGFSKLEELTHSGENLLGLLRDGKLHLTTDITSALLAMVDAVRALLAKIEKTNGEGDADYSTLIHSLDALQPAVTETQSHAAPIAPPSFHESGDDLHFPGGETISESEAAQEYLISSTDRLLQGESSPEYGAAQVARSSRVDSSIRVDVSVLDRLMNLVGELVLARNHLLQFNAARHGDTDASFAYAAQRLNLITSELQEGVMKTRMQPIRGIWQKFPRVVRDLAMACGKRVRMEMEGEDTELDKTLIEAIKDPLTHLIRNALDHGFERPEVRTACGKPAEGRLLLRAYHQGGQVRIELSDDGAGIQLDAVKHKAMQNDLINAAQAARMNDREALNLIFLHGFSTASQVTNVSGRGVGMDVVKTNVEKIGGAIDIESLEGRGTTVKMTIPLTLAIIPALIVTSGGDRFAIPQVNVLELVRLEPDAKRSSIEMIHESPVCRLRDKLLPLVDLGRELHLADAAPMADSLRGQAIQIVVLQAGSRQFGLVVDGIQNTEEIVVKPLGRQLQDITAYAGATIMGDGKVALILDVQGIFRSAGVAQENAPALDREQAPVMGARQQHLILCELRDGTRVALPMEGIERLEEFPPHRLERIGAREVVQYRGEIMPLFDVASAMSEPKAFPEAKAFPTTGASPEFARARHAADRISVLVHRRAKSPIGIRVEQILDVCMMPEGALRPPQRPGARGTLVINGRVTELLDVSGLSDLVVPALDGELYSVPMESRV